LKGAFLKTIKLMAIYSVLSVLFSFIIHGNVDLADWLEPFKFIVLFDLIPIEGFNQSDGVYRESPTREIICTVLNIALMFIAHFLSFHVKRDWLRKTLVIISSTVFIAWYIFITYALGMSSAA
jgi:hypothetical protein